ncbi:anterior gradient 1 isoform X2 [Acanthopagrus latus]|uniref:anterior gradient 1 isoform X2 n=1 Tax=Acanthopagrus latus TaxID=8177 RepID=UPI00187CDF2C|nr:anterior gradient 1 isoform X2 [Acanthopagrus latus]
MPDRQAEGRQAGRQTGRQAGRQPACHCSSLKGQEVMLRWVLFALFFGICASAGKQKGKQAAKSKSPDLSRGWGHSIKWVKSYSDGLAEMVQSQKPLMVIHHKEDCPHSQALKKAFVANKSIMKMAREDFIMLNLVGESGDKNLAPDGFYVPRILFVDPTLMVRTDIQGKFRDHLYTYEPADVEALANNMRKAKVLMHLDL